MWWGEVRNRHRWYPMMSRLEAKSERVSLRWQHYPFDVMKVKSLRCVWFLLKTFLLVELHISPFLLSIPLALLLTRNIPPSGKYILFRPCATSSTQLWSRCCEHGALIAQGHQLWPRRPHAALVSPALHPQTQYLAHACGWQMGCCLGCEFGNLRKVKEGGGEGVGSRGAGSGERGREERGEGRGERGRGERGEGRGERGEGRRESAVPQRGIFNPCAIHSRRWVNVGGKRRSGWVVELLAKR